MKCKLRFYPVYSILVILPTTNDLFTGLKVHLKRHKSTGDLTCPEDGCHKVFASFSSFNTHVLKKHSSYDDLSLAGSSNNTSDHAADARNSYILFENSNNKQNSDGVDCSTSFQPSSSSVITVMNIKSEKDTGQATTCSSNHVESNAAAFGGDGDDPLTLQQQHPQQQQSYLEALVSTLNGPHSVNSSSKLPYSLKDTVLPKEEPIKDGEAALDMTNLQMAYFQPQYTETCFNYTSTPDSTSSDSTQTETISTTNPSDILELLHQSYFTIDDSDASLKLLNRAEHWQYW